MTFGTRVYSRYYCYVIHYIKHYSFVDNVWIKKEQLNVSQRKHMCVSVSLKKFSPRSRKSRRTQIRIEIISRSKQRGVTKKERGRKRRRVAIWSASRSRLRFLHVLFRRVDQFDFPPRPRVREETIVDCARQASSLVSRRI